MSYTNFNYSNLQLQTSVDGVTPVQVSATVTNDGAVAGSDVAQLYLGYPAAAGEPPRKLVDFQRVTLSPGASTTVHFTIAPQDEWWWNNKAWDETAGSYNVYVGDSSALADLKLTRSYSMGAAIGNRRVTVVAPRSFGPGGTGHVQVTLSAGGNETLDHVSLALAAPGGWRVVPLASTLRDDVQPCQAITVQFDVTAPAGAVTQDVTLYGTANLAAGACTSSTSVVALEENPATLLRNAAQVDGSCTPVTRHGGTRTRLAG